MDYGKKAAELLNREGVVCAPSVFGAFADVCGISEEQALKTAACFGGGIGPALLESFDADRAAPQQLIDMARRWGIDLRRFEVR